MKSSVILNLLQITSVISHTNEDSGYYLLSEKTVKRFWRKALVVPSQVSYYPPDSILFSTKYNETWPVDEFFKLKGDKFYMGADCKIYQRPHLHITTSDNIVRTKYFDNSSDLHDWYSRSIANHIPLVLLKSDWV